MSEEEKVCIIVTTKKSGRRKSGANRVFAMWYVSMSKFHSCVRLSKTTCFRIRFYDICEMLCKIWFEIEKCWWRKTESYNCWCRNWIMKLIDNEKFLLHMWLEWRRENASQVPRKYFPRSTEAATFIECLLLFSVAEVTQLPREKDNVIIKLARLKLHGNKMITRHSSALNRCR